VRFSPTQDTFALLRWLDEMWPELVAKAGRKAQFRHVRVDLFDLVETGQRQHDLFLRADRDGSRTRRGEALWHEIARLTDRALTALSPDCYFRGSLYSGAG
jgi:hypothetical protein